MRTGVVRPVRCLRSCAAPAEVPGGRVAGKFEFSCRGGVDLPSSCSRGSCQQFWCGDDRGLPGRFYASAPCTCAWELFDSDTTQAEKDFAGGRRILPDSRYAKHLSLNASLFSRSRYFWYGRPGPVTESGQYVAARTVRKSVDPFERGCRCGWALAMLDQEHTNARLVPHRGVGTESTNANRNVLEESLTALRVPLANCPPPDRHLLPCASVAV